MKASQVAAVLLKEIQDNGDCEVTIFTSAGFSRKSFMWTVGSVARDVNKNEIVIDAEMG